MKVEINEVGELQRRLVFRLPSGALNKAIQEKLTTLGNTVRLDGFRPGKVPKSLLVSRYAKSVRTDIVRDMVSEYLAGIVKEMRVRLAGHVVLNGIRELVDEDLEVTCTVEIMSEFELANLNSGVILRYRVPDNDENLVQFVQHHIGNGLLGKEESEEPVKDGDSVLLSFENAEDVALFSSDKGGKLLLSLAGLPQDDLLLQTLLGVSKGEQCSVHCDFPEDFPHEKMAGIKRSVRCTVERVWTKLQENPGKEALLDQIREKQDAHDYESKIRGLMKNSLDAGERSCAHWQVDALLLERHHFPVPECLVTSQTAYLAEAVKSWEPVRLLRTFVAYGEDALKKIATRQIKLNELRAKVLALTNFKFDEDHFYQSLAGLPGYENIKKNPPSEETMARLREAEQVNQAERVMVKWALERVDVQDREVSYSEFLEHYAKLRRADLLFS